MRRLLLALLLFTELTLAGTGMARKAAAAALTSPAADTAATDPSDTVRAFYTALDAKDFNTAYGLVSNRYRAAHPFSSWVAGYAATLLIGVDASPTDDPATISVYLTAVNSDGYDGAQVERFGGTWSLISDGAGGWLLDTASIGVVGEPSAYASLTTDFGLYANDWYHHGYGFSLRADGTAVVSWRTYGWCSTDPTPPCDALVGDTIIWGGSGSIAFDQAFGSSAVGVVTSSNWDVVMRPTETVTLTLLPFGTAVLVQPEGVTILCSATEAPTTPVSLLQLCGA